jgi:2,3-bisphosphoglycerate-independent phosphoglycerate mutase
MDRNKEWDRTQKTYTMLTMPDQQTQFKNWHDALTYYYEHNITDEFIPPTLLDQQKIITDGDGIVFYNTRPDRARQLTHAFVDPDFSEFKIQKISPAFFITPTRYSKELRTDNVLEKETVPNTLMEILCQHNISTFAIAETEKYAHVTYFFNSGRETEFPSETRVLVPSITATSYKDLPHMQAAHITEHVLQALATNKYDFYLINYANPDMVGHSGDFEATKKAITYIDTQLEILYKKFITEHEGTLYITADHGNAELKYNKELKQAHTEHTTNPVEFIFVNQRVKDKQTELPLKELKDIAPFILQNLNIQVPHQMKA